MQRENQRSKLFTRRALLLAGGQTALLAALAGRMYYLQVTQSDRYTVLADENRINLRLLAPPRGRIIDRFGLPLATNTPNYRVVLVAEQAGEIDVTLDAIDQLIGLTEADRRRVQRDIKRKHSFVPVVVRANLTWDEMARIEVNVPELPGVMIEEGLSRTYPFAETAAHVLGYVAPVSEKELNGDPLLELPDFRIGKSGIEKQHDLELRGKAGTSQIETNAYGRVVRELARVEGTPGKEMVLTLDMALQDLAARRCAAEQSASCVVLDAFTGDVLALVSSPGFDPIAFGAGLTAVMWRDLTTNIRNPLSNKAISGTYSPGSTFKPMVALAGLESGLITPETVVSCPGSFFLGNTVFHCWRHGGHGGMNLRNAIKNSCDVFFYETARRLGIDRIAAMAKRFGLGSKLDFDLPGERPGNIPTRDWNLATYGVAWQLGETISAGIGQSKVTTTPLQLATMAARLITNRAVVPRLTRREGVMQPVGLQTAPDHPESLFPSLGIPPANLKLVVDGMTAVVNEQGGTAYGARIREAGLEMGGKSGTSQVRHISAAEREHGVRKTKDVPWKERDHALFISFAPVSSPRYVCAVVVEHGGESAGGGSAVAAPICRDVLREAQLRDPGRRVPDAEFVATRDDPAGPSARRS
ncbi:MAG: peptidoglycan glycosyltransferase [Rhodospirillales bacterium]|nr:peptidoglycan glycosyltransferase [Rhodospirillales bacterium]